MAETRCLPEEGKRHQKGKKTAGFSQFVANAKRMIVVFKIAILSNNLVAFHSQVRHSCLQLSLISSTLSESPNLSQ